MIQRSHSIYLSFFVLLLSSMLACTNGGSEGDSTGGGDDGSAPPSGSFRSDCGVVVNGELKNPVAASDGQNVTVQVTGPNQAIVTSGGQRFLVKLHGLANVSDFRRGLAVSKLEQLAAGGAIYFEAEEECTDSVTGGGTAFVGQLFTPNGLSFAEELLRDGIGRPDTSERCGGNELASCYRALEDSGEQLGGQLSNFLWKPVAERDGKLVILFNPGGGSVTVNGETLTFSGASNGRGTTVRGDRPGCAYGANVVVRARDRSGRILLFPGGAKELIIQNGCDRVEF